MVGPARPQTAHWYDVDFRALAFHCHYEAEGGALALSGSLPGGREQGALCVERPFSTSSIMELLVSQVRRLLLCISRVRATHKCLALCEGLGHPRPLIFARAIWATHAHSPAARSIFFCVIWVCISSSSSSREALWLLSLILEKALSRLDLAPTPVRTKTEKGGFVGFGVSCSRHRCCSF